MTFYRKKSTGLLKDEYSTDSPCNQKRHNTQISTIWCGHLSYKGLWKQNRLFLTIIVYV